MYGDPALPSDFAHLPYANPNAPKGGRIVLGNTGGFNSLNPFVRKGTPPWQLRFFTHESLMGRSWDEPFALYGLLAKTIEVPEDRSWVEFTLRPEAQFSNGSPVTVDDVIFSYELLGKQGHPRYLSLYQQIERIEKTGPNRVRFDFATDNRELALLAGMRPILSRAQWEGVNFADAPLQKIPIGSGPYTVADYEVGRFVRLERNPDYWGAQIPFRRGTHNYDEIKIDFYADGNIMFEALKGGEISAGREFNTQKWASQYDFPAVERGEVALSTFPHQKPSGMTGFVFNTRRAPFDDWRVRDALIHAFNFEYINDTLTGGAVPRITSYFSNSALAARSGAAGPAVSALLTPYADILPPDTLTGYALPVSDGSLRNRRGIRAALALLEAAGFSAADGTMRDAAGEPLSFTILLAPGSAQDFAQSDKAATLYVQALSRLGIEAKIEQVDSAQMTERFDAFDFDITSFRRALSLSPGNEQRFYWGAQAADQPGTRNVMGVKSPAIDAMIDTMLTAKGAAQFTAAVLALDRVLTAGRYVIPIWQFNEGRIAHRAEMRYPARLPLYGDGPNFMPEVWWWEEM
ncbi:MAG: extracellular solute-binding protein [Pseudomonadota bacterium]